MRTTIALPGARADRGHGVVLRGGRSAAASRRRRQGRCRGGDGRRRAIHSGEVRRMVVKATGGKPVAAAAMPFLQAEALEEIVCRRSVLAYAQRQGEAATAAQLDAALAELKANLRAQRRSMEDFLKGQSVTEADLHRQLAWNVVWQRYLARYVTPAQRRGLFSGPSSRVGRQPGFGEPDPAAAGRGGRAVNARTRW